MQALEVCREAGDKRGEAASLWWTGRADLAENDLRAACVRLTGALRAFQTFEMHEELLGCIEDIAALLNSRGERFQAIQLCAAVERLRERLALLRSPRAERRLQEEIQRSRESMDARDFGRAWSAGSTYQMHEAVELALAATSNESATT